MQLRNFIMKHVWFFCVIICIGISSCQNSNTTNSNQQHIAVQQSKPLTDIVEGKIFSVPSPYEGIQLIRSLNISFNQSLLIPTSNKQLVTSNIKKCLHIGICGIDISYSSLFEQTSSALSLFSLLKSLSEDIGVTHIFNQSIFEQLEKNIDIQDSLLIILTNSYREADKHLKSENQREQAGLIIAGSWIESLYLLTQIYKDFPHKKIAQKIAEHKYYADNVLELIRPYYSKSKEHKHIIDIIVELGYQFDGIATEYEYKAPITYPQIKRTVLQSNSKLIIYNEHIENITSYVEKLRNSIL